MMHLRTLFSLLFFVLLFQFSATAQSLFMIEDFEAETLGDLPSQWYNQKGEAKPITYTGELRETYNYKVQEEDGNRFLRFEGRRGKHLNYPLINKEDVNIHETPILSWRWRIHDIPEGGNEGSSKNNDVAASIYVVFDMGHILFRKVPKSIRYTWSSSLEPGKELAKLNGNQRILVMGTGENTNGDWITFERNIVEDYKHFFGDEAPEKPLAVLILSDGNDTKKNVKADYDDIMLKSPHDN